MARADIGQPSAGWALLKYMCDEGDGDGVDEQIRQISEERATGHLAHREAFLREEIWKTVPLVGIVDRLYSERRVLVGHIVFGKGAWTARAGRVVMFMRERGQLNGVDVRISLVQLTIKQRQEEVHPVHQIQQQRPSSARREPTLVDPLAAGGRGIAGDQQQRQPLPPPPPTARLKPILAVVLDMKRNER